MEELKTLIDAVAGLPNAALWVVGALLIYKLATLAALYGCIRFCVGKFIDAYTNRHRFVRQDASTQVDRLVIEGAKENLMAALERMQERPGIHSHYLHRNDTKWLLDAVNEKIAAERAMGEKK